MKQINKSFVENKKSKFYGYLYEVNSLDEVAKVIESIKIEHKKAKHIVYAYKIGNYEKKYEDKEPSGTAGAPLLDLINIKRLDCALIIVVRYFGGTLLGRGLLTRSYREAGNKLFNLYNN